MFACSGCERRWSRTSRVRATSRPSAVLDTSWRAGGAQPLSRVLPWRLRPSPRSCYRNEIAVAESPWAMSVIAYERTPVWSHGFQFASSIRRQSGLQGALKRAVDIVLAAGALMVLAVPMMVIALVIKLDSRGPALLGQERVGRELELFRMYK